MLIAYLLYAPLSNAFLSSFLRECNKKKEEENP